MAVPGPDARLIVLQVAVDLVVGEVALSHQLVRITVDLGFVKMGDRNQQKTVPSSTF